MIDLKKIVVFDIETTGTLGTLAELHQKNPKMAELWSKRCEFLRERYANNAELSDAELWSLKSGLHAEFGRVVCVSFGIYRGDGFHIESMCTEDETELLRWSSSLLGNTDRLGMSLAGHTIKRFDIPFLWKRYLASGMKPPAAITTWSKKPWDLTFFDVAEFWSNGTWQEGFTSLDVMSTMFGFASPKEAVQASRVHNVFWEDRDLDSIQKYCDGDVRATMEVIKRMADVCNQ